MSKRIDEVSFSPDHRKLIVGEGESDRNFIAHFCAKHGIEGFQYAHTAQGSETGNGGFDVFDKYLSRVPGLAGFSYVTDIVLFCDSAEDADKQFNELRAKVNKTKGYGPGNTEVRFTAPDSRNVVSGGAPLRLHVLMIPHDDKGGLETLCVRAAIEAVENGGQIIGWVNTFADSACNGWTTEKRDKLRMQAFISATADKKPEMTFCQLYDIMRSKIVPLDSAHLSQIKDFLNAVAAL